MVPLYAARVADLDPGGSLRIECVCGHETPISHSALLHGLRLRPDYRIADLPSRLRCRGASRFAGDSAGGGLVVAAMVAIRDAGLPQPGCAWCISPWVDMEAIGDTTTSKAETDPTVQRAGILDMARLYLNGADPRSPLAAPLYADLAGLAPLLIQVGAETLLDDAVRLAKAAGAADVYVELQIWPEMIHVWHLSSSSFSTMGYLH